MFNFRNNIHDGISDAINVILFQIHEGVRIILQIKALVHVFAYGADVCGRATGIWVPKN